jgi:hypothetical protein
VKIICTPIRIFHQSEELNQKLFVLLGHFFFKRIYSLE